MKNLVQIWNVFQILFLIRFIPFLKINSGSRGVLVLTELLFAETDFQSKSFICIREYRVFLVFFKFLIQLILKKILRNIPDMRLFLMIFRVQRYDYIQVPKRRLKRLQFFIFRISIFHSFCTVVTDRALLSESSEAYECFFVRSDPSVYFIRLLIPLLPHNCDAQIRILIHVLRVCNSVRKNVE